MYGVGSVTPLIDTCAVAAVKKSSKAMLGGHNFALINATLSIWASTATRMGDIVCRKIYESRFRNFCHFLGARHCDLSAPEKR